MTLAGWQQSQRPLNQGLLNRPGFVHIQLPPRSVWNSTISLLLYKPLYSLQSPKLSKPKIMERSGTVTMNSLTATFSIVEALVGMKRAIDAAGSEISSSSPLSALNDLVHILSRYRGEIEDGVVSLEAAAEAEASPANRDATASGRLGVRFLCLKVMAKSLRRCLEEQRWGRCTERGCHGSTEKRVLSLKRFAAMACREAEKRVARLPEPRVSVAEAAQEVVDDAEGTALAEFRAMAKELLAIGKGGDAMEESEEYRGILRRMGRSFSSA